MVTDNFYPSWVTDNFYPSWVTDNFCLVELLLTSVLVELLITYVVVELLVTSVLVELLITYVVVELLITSLSSLVPSIHEPPDETLVIWLRERKFDDDVIETVSYASPQRNLLAQAMQITLSLIWQEMISWHKQSVMWLVYRCLVFFFRSHRSSLCCPISYRLFAMRTSSA